MKFSRLPRSAALLALAVSAGACNDGLTDYNDNPNAPTDVSVQYLLPQGIQSAASLALGYNLNLDLTELWVQHVAEVQYAEEDIYELRTGDVDGAFRGFYTGPLADFQMIINKGEATNKPNHEAVGRIMKAWTFSIMTDMWGDIPYSEALKGQGEDATITPAYDAQADIYAGLLAELKAANDMITMDPSGGSFGSEDLIYGGDMAQWKLFANSLRLRLAMRLSEADPAKGKAEFASAMADGVFTSNAQNAELAYLSGPPNENPWYVSFKTRDDHRVSATLVGTLESLNDPRLPVYAAPIADDPTGAVIIGMPNGMEEHDFSWTSTSEVGAFFQAPDQPAQMMTYAEVLFLQAEAAQRGWIGGDAAALYRDAITANMQYYGIAAGEIAAYLAQPEVAYNAGSWQESIGMQKWIALFGNGPEAFAEMRRLGFPVVTPGPDAVIDVVPNRYPYPESEQSFNKTNLESAISRQGGADLTSTVWWDR